jgi:Tol biopolymer transport system component
MGKGDNTNTMSSAFFRRPAVVLILGLCLIGGGVSLLSRLASGPSTEPKRVTLPHEGGTEAAPAFSPDGKRLAFSAREAARNSPYHLRVRTLAGGAIAQLTDGPASDLGPAWSPDGARIAFLRVDEDRARYMVFGSDGGEPRQVADFPVPDPAPGPQPAVSWSRDGQSLYVVQWAEGQPPFLATVPAAGGALRRITQPPAGTPGDGSPAISPDGATLAFVRQISEKGQNDDNGEGRTGSDIYLSDLSGNNLRRLTFDKAAIHGVAWSADGQDLIYAARRLDQEKLWRVAAAGGSPRNVLAGGRNPAYPAVATAGRHLAFTETPALDTVWRVDLTAADPASSARLLIHSDGREYAPSWSPDGKKIANISTLTGNDEIWVGDADGNNRAPITHLKAWRLGPPRWSPDGRTLLVVVRGNGTMEVDRVASDGHTPPARVPLPDGSHQVSWSHDGQWIYFQAMGLWRAHTDGQQAQKLVSNWEASEPEESSDGKEVYFRRDRSIWRIPVAGGAEEEIMTHERDARWTAFQSAATGLYYLELDREERTVAARFYDLRSKKSRELLRLPVTDPSDISTLAVSPDGRYVLYPTVDHAETTLVLTENFR